MDERPTRISIVSPSFKQLDWLSLCIASVADQVSEGDASFTVEHLVQDGGTPHIDDASAEWRKMFQRTGYNLQVITEKDSGMYDALNRGFARATGDIAAWLNSDEQYLPGTLRYVCDFFRDHPGVDVLLGDALLLDSGFSPISYRRIMKPNRLHTQLDHLHSLSCAMFMRRKCLPSPVFDPRWRIIGDAVLVDGFLKRGLSIKACGVPLSVYAFTGQNLSAMTAQAREHGLWHPKSSIASRLATPIVKLVHRIRRLVHGAYGPFQVQSQIYTHTSPVKRSDISAMVKGTWPKPADRNG